MRVQHGRTPGLTIVVALAVLLGHSGPARAESADATAVFSGEPTREAVTRLAQSNPRQCVTSVSPAKVCVWRLEPGSVAYAVLANILGATDTLSLVCEIGGTEPGRCTVHTASYAQRSRTTKSDHVAAWRRAEALERIAEARSLTALAHRVGAVPDECIQRNETEWVCVWRAEPGAPAHQIIAEAAGTAGWARLVCLLPLDGSERAADSCRAFHEE